VHTQAMPVILQPEDYEAWLTADWADAAHLVEPYPPQFMAMV
jgi:putative SOS response-associated peptidase YedK